MVNFHFIHVVVLRHANSVYCLLNKDFKKGQKKTNGAGHEP